MNENMRIGTCSFIYRSKIKSKWQCVSTRINDDRFEFIIRSEIFIICSRRNFDV